MDNDSRNDTERRLEERAATERRQMDAAGGKVRPTQPAFAEEAEHQRRHPGGPVQDLIGKDGSGNGTAVTAGAKPPEPPEAPKPQDDATQQGDGTRPRRPPRVPGGADGAAA